MYTINQLSEELGVNQNKIRRWEDSFSISVNRNIKGHREYDDFTVDVFKKIKNWLSQGMTTNEVKIHLNQGLGSYQNFDNHTPKVEILENEEPEKENNLLLQTFTSQLDKAQKEIRELIYENADLRSKVTFFELRARDHEKNINMLLEAKQETIEILREEKIKIETELKKLKEVNNQNKEKKNLFDFLFMKV